MLVFSADAARRSWFLPFSLNAPPLPYTFTPWYEGRAFTDQITNHPLWPFLAVRSRDCLVLVDSPPAHTLIRRMGGQVTMMFSPAAAPCYDPTLSFEQCRAALRRNNVRWIAITVEDPVEYRIAGINQVQVNAKAGLSFSNALKSILRSDPDIVMVGEIRDRETATIAIELALTGHLVLSSLHTNDAPSTPARLIEMGVEPYLVSSALDCVVAQRLARRLCENCKVAYKPTYDELTTVRWEDWSKELPGQLFKAGSCNVCSNTGYRGRFAIHEVMEISDDMERLVASGGKSHEIRELAIIEGMTPMKFAGFQQVLAGVTSIEEILRVIA